jgi:pimeloyl-ACP methyl ester carboxylesterase
MIRFKWSVFMFLILGGSLLAADTPTIVLLHGAFEDASVWKEVQTHLKEAGYHSIAVDLPGRPSNPMDAKATSLDLYRDTVLRATEKEKSPVVLVGHSFGGVTISVVAEAAPEKIRSLIYVAAYLPLDGESLLSLAQMDKTSQVKQTDFIVNQEKLIASIAHDRRAFLFANDCTKAVREAIPDTLLDEPVIAQGTPVKLTESKYGKVPRCYIHTTKDHVISFPFQEEMVSRAKVAKSVKLDCGHTPFLSQPKKLAEAIAELAK